MKASRVGMVFVALVALGGSGCRTSMHKVQMERVDQSLAGNSGYLVGHPRTRAARSGTREIAELQVELPNRMAPGTPMGTVTPPAAAEPSTAQTPSPATTESVSELYTVKKGDTLWGIARKCYGKGGLWSRIYEANRDKLPEPRRLRPGMRLRIPRDITEPSTAPTTYEK